MLKVLALLAFCVGSVFSQGLFPLVPCLRLGN